MILVSKTYLSRANSPFKATDLEALLQTCRANNTTVNVTGALIHHNQYFLQLIEGEEQQVGHIYRRIEQDPRHEILSILFEDEISARFFPDWSMGYREAETIHSDALNRILESAKMAGERFPISDFLLMFGNED